MPRVHEELSLALRRAEEAEGNARFAKEEADRLVLYTQSESSKQVKDAINATYGQTIHIRL